MSVANGRGVGLHSIITLEPECHPASSGHPELPTEMLTAGAPTVSHTAITAS